MAIKIYCDLCGSEREMNQIRGVETLKGGSSVWFNEPKMEHSHFVCTECLAKIGIIEGRDTGRVIEQAAEPRKEIRRRRGVSVVLYWKNGDGFEVCNSIASAVDRIAEKTGTVIQGADISHGLLKDRMYNSNDVTIRYADASAQKVNEEQEELIQTEGVNANA